MGLKIDVGCGFRKRPGFIGIDNNPECHSDHVLDLSRDRLPLKDKSVDEVYSYHTLEYIEDLQHLLRELYRVSKNGAVWNIYVHHWSSIIGKALGHRNYFDETFFDNLNQEASRHWRAFGLNLRVEKVGVVRGRLRFWKKYTIHYMLRVVK